MGDDRLAPEALLDRFSRQRLLVIGDLMLDWFIWGGVARISPEAPVPVVEVQRESRYPGGAANVARNMIPFGTSVELAGLYGEDPNGSLLAETLAECGIGVGSCLRRADVQTITKTRVVARHQQVVRIDRERHRPLPEAQARELLAGLEPVLSSVDGIVIEDYGKGLVTAELVGGLLSRVGSSGPVITVDPKPGNPLPWRGVTTVKPNRSEAFACAGIGDEHRDQGVPPLEDGPLLRAGETLLDAWACRQVLLTLGEQGMLVFSAGEGAASPVHIPAREREVFDVSGAGDTAIAVYTLGLCAGLGAPVAAAVSNLASSIVVGKLGTTPVERDEFLQAASEAFSDGIPATPE